MSRRWRLLAVVGVFTLAVGAAACGLDDGGGTESTDPVVFGEGTVPEAFPSDFPIPLDSVIGSTLVDTVNNRSEFRVTTTADRTSVIQFFEVGLVNRGYVINSSDGNSSEWTITFSNGELKGTILAIPQGAGITAAVVSINRS